MGRSGICGRVNGGGGRKEMEPEEVNSERR